MGILTTVLLSHTARPVFVRETTNSSSDTQEIVMEDGDSTTTSSPPREIGMVSTDRRITLMVLPTHFMLKMTLTHSSTTEPSTTHPAAESVCSSQLNSWMPVTSTPLTSGTVPFSSTSPKIHQRPTILLGRTQTSSRRWETV